MSETVSGLSWAYPARGRATAGVSYTVTLASQPTEEVTVTVSGHADTDVSLDETTLTFTTGNWNSAQTVTVTAIQDTDGADDSVTLTHTASGGQYDGVSAELQITVADTTPISVSFGSDKYSAEEGGEAAEVVIELSKAPAAQVVILLMATGHDGATEDDWSGVPASVSFDAGETSKSFMVTAVDDDVEDNGEMVELAFGALPDGFVVGTTSTARVTLMNDDQPQSTPTAPECDDLDKYVESDIDVPDNMGKQLPDQDRFIGGHTPHLQVGQTVEGYIEPCSDMRFGGDADMFRIELEEGKYYRVDLQGSASGDGTLILPVLQGYFTADGFYPSYPLNSYPTNGEPVWYRPSDGKRPFHLAGFQEIFWVDSATDRQKTWVPLGGGSAYGNHHTQNPYTRSGPRTENTRGYLMWWPTGTFYLLVGSYGYNIGTYRVSLTEVTDDDSGIRTIEVDGSASGTLDYYLDEDTFEVELEENRNLCHSRRAH